MKQVAGFTLIELLIVVTVIGILATWLLSYIDPKTQLQKVEDIRRKSDLAYIQRGLEQYYKDNGSYPLSTGSLDEKPYRIKGFKADHLVIDWGQEWQPYMEVLPKDQGSKQYVYIGDRNGQSYRLYASLERGKNDAGVCKADGSVCAGVPSGVTCGDIHDICNYGVSSPNVSP